jgi:RNA polymerase sigma-70 factor (ECF subfamily)
VVLLVRERVKLLAYITAIVRDIHLAEDVYQEVATMAVRKRGEIRDAGHFLAWMRLAARHRSLNVLRQRKHCELLDSILLDKFEPLWAEQDASRDSDLLEAISDCLEKLSPASRTLVELRYTQGISGVKLAETVNRNLNTVYVALSRIHKAIGDCIKERLISGRFARD